MNRIEMEWFQREVGEWGDRTFGRSSPASVVAHFTREAVEFASDPSPEEAADCFMLLLHHAHKCGYSLGAAAVEKFEVNKKRTWGAPDSEGVCEHIDDAAPDEGRPASFGGFSYVAACPYCDEMNTDPLDDCVEAFDGAQWQTTCSRCGRDYLIRLRVSTEFATAKAREGALNMAEEHG